MPEVLAGGKIAGWFEFEGKAEPKIYESRDHLLEALSKARAEHYADPANLRKEAFALWLADLYGECGQSLAAGYNDTGRLLGEALNRRPSDKDGRSDPKFDNKSAPEPDPLHPGTSAPWNELQDDPRSAAIRHVSRLQTDEYYRACVAELEAKAASAFNAAALTMWGPHLPIAAPCLWKDRNKAAEQNPADFIRAVYSEWLPHLSKRDLLYLDRSLYFTYAKWLGANGKDAPPVEFGGNPRGRLDDAVYGAAMRQKNQTGIAKLRAAKRDRGGLTHLP